MAAPAVAGTPCANCGSMVLNRYCGACGQRLEHSVHSVWHFTREATEDLTHADSRLWRTLAALLFKPGLLTSEYLAGRRARYLPPFRLYLILSLLFFLGATSSQNTWPVVQFDGPDGGNDAVTVTPASDVLNSAARPGETPQQREARICNVQYNGPARAFVEPFVRKGCRDVVRDHGRSLGEAFMHNLPRAIFLFLPLLALVMLGMYWRPRHYYVEHLLFFVHNHAFVFLMFGLLWLATKLAPAAVTTPLTVIVWLYLPYYVFVSMRRVYGQSRLRTFTKLVVLSFAYSFGGVSLLLLTTVYSALML